MFGRTRSLLGLALVATVAACSTPTLDPVGNSSSSVSGRTFDKDNVIDDASLRDVDAMSADDVQKFLEETPWNKASVLATYEENGKSAATIIHEASVKYGINPLELLVRAQMEQGLINKATATDAVIKKAFGCGCPDGSTCATRYSGLTAQAECAAGTLRRSMDRAVTAQGTVSGWARSRAKESQDGLTITPANAATAALYTYTPWVGEAGGGRAGVGGVSLHFRVWNQFSNALGFAATTASDDTGADDTGADTDTDAGTGTGTGTDAGTGTGTGTGTPDAGSTPVDPDPTPTDPDPADPTDPAPGEEEAGSAPPEDGSEDAIILGEGNIPPASNAPPATAKNRTSTGPEDLPEATEEELAIRRRAAEGCSTSGGSSDASSGFAMFGLVAAAVLATRRRRDR